MAVIMVFHAEAMAVVPDIQFYPWVSLVETWPVPFTSGLSLSESRHAILLLPFFSETGSHAAEGDLEILPPAPDPQVLG